MGERRRGAAPFLRLRNDVSVSSFHQQSRKPNFNFFFLTLLLSHHAKEMAAGRGAGGRGQQA